MIRELTNIEASAVTGGCMVISTFADVVELATIVIGLDGIRLTLATAGFGIMGTGIVLTAVGGGHIALDRFIFILFV